MLKKFIKIVGVAGILLNTGITAATENYYKVRTHNISPPVTLSGTVIPEKEVTFTAQLPGRVEMIAGEEGDEFDEDTILVVLDDRQLLAKRRAAIAEWRRADAALRNADMQYWREQRSPDSPEKAPGGMGLPNLLDQIVTKPLSDLLGQGDTGIDRRAQLHSFGTRIEQARSALWQAQSGIEEIDAKLRDSQSIAPFNGVIIKKLVEVGDTVMMGQPLLEFANTGHLQIKVDVPARLVRGLKIGKKASAKLDVLDEPVVVFVAQIFPIADEQRHTVKVKFDLSIDRESEFGQYVGPGQYAQVDVPDVKADSQKLFLIPKVVVNQRGSLPAVCVFKKEKYERRVVRLGSNINPSLVNDLDSTLGDYVSVLSGLEEGDLVVINQTPGKKFCR
ncbi:efflux RND transporter periplasmic adaptor subunit [Candidatus Parabeggiatoa sp. HSG14]|uniref:efflux RND transporter periplasmic adaptor subunit n=1 Tax=Candidatus Parabeggiatoa sp. HSG14 TaxID=3055593 RepID=UPI0025A7ADE0|nr:efflux RND transporter periplasmic adaptor subunit [Thiotrichales bacterium HSG14]